MTDKKIPSIYDLYATDTSLENDGVVVEFMPGISVVIRSTYSDKFIQIHNKLRKPHLRQIQKGQISDELAFDIMLKSVIKGILIDWQGFTDRDGNELPFSEEAAFTLLSDPSMKRLLDDIYEAASSQATFMAEDKEEAADALKKSSDGKSSGQK